MTNEILPNENVIPEIDSAQMSYTAAVSKCNLRVTFYIDFIRYIEFDLFRKYEKHNKYRSQKLDHVCTK